VGSASAGNVGSVIFSSTGLESAVRAIVAQAGSEPREAEQVAQNLVLANASGHDSHGIGMLPRYVGALLDGDLLPNRHVRVELDTGTLLRLDAGSGYGQVAGFEAMELGCSRARQHGVCVVALANSHHLGRIGHWAEQCLDAGLVSLHFVNVVSRPIVAPFGGLDARTGTNPVCIGIPRTGEPPILLDFATSRVAQGKTRVAFNRGEQLPLGYVIDNRGEPTREPRYSVMPPYGALLPMGEHKGFGLALVAELLGGALTGASTLHEPHAGRRRILNGMLSVLIDPGQLGTAASFAEQTEAYLRWVRESPAPPDGDGVQLPGEPERRARERCAREGIRVDATTWEEILAAAESVGLARAECQRLASSGHRP
jgi:hydroxycarboxylate dehydrogenase B